MDNSGSLDKHNEPLRSVTYEDAITDGQQSRPAHDTYDGRSHGDEIYEHASNTRVQNAPVGAVWNIQAGRWPHAGHTSSGVATQPGYGRRMPVPQYPPHCMPRPIGALNQDRHVALPITSQHPIGDYGRGNFSGAPGFQGGPPSSIYHPYGLQTIPQSHPAIRGQSFVPVNPDRLPSREMAEADSSGVTCGSSSHINRKKRKACGRCGPCQTKNNCGTCMNCVNRAKGKQICIFRKCEELKKKPSTGCYAAPERNTDMIANQEKRKGLGSLVIGERKRSRTEDFGGTLTPQTLPLQQQPVHKFPVYTSYRHQLNFDSSSTQRTTALPPKNTSSHVIPGPADLAAGSSCSNLFGNAAPDDTTDIISQALRQIDDHTESAHLEISNNSFLHPQSTFQKEVTQENYQRHQRVSESFQTQQQWASNLMTPAEPANSTSNTHISTSPIQIAENSYQNSQVLPENRVDDSTALPDQILNNLAQFNEIGSFRGNSSAATSSLCISERVLPVVPDQASNYAGDRCSALQEYSKPQAGIEVECAEKNSVNTTSASQEQSTPVSKKPDLESCHNQEFVSSHTAMYQSPDQNVGYGVSNPAAPADAVIPCSNVGLISSHMYHPTMHHSYVSSQTMSNLYSGVPNISVERQNLGQGVWQPPSFHQTGRPVGGNTQLGVAQQREQFFVDTSTKQMQNNEFLSNHHLSTSGPGNLMMPHRSLNRHPSAGQPLSTWGVPGAQHQLSPAQPNVGTGPAAASNVYYDQISHRNVEYGNMNFQKMISMGQNAPLNSTLHPRAPSAPHGTMSDSFGVVSAAGLDRNSGISRLPNMLMPFHSSEAGGQNLAGNRMSPHPSSEASAYKPPGEWAHPVEAAAAAVIGANASESGSRVINPEHFGFEKGVMNDEMCEKVKDERMSSLLPQDELPKPTTMADFLSPQSAHATSEISSSPGPMSHHSLKSDPGNAVPVVVNPSADTNITISPGESGYDSTEVLHAGEDFLDRPNHASVSASFEAKKVMQDDFQPEAPDINKKEICARSKNLYRAPAGHRAVSVIRTSSAVLHTELPSAGACAIKLRLQSENFPVTIKKTLLADDVSLRSKRSASCDCDSAMRKPNLDVEEKRPVKLRRYSLQEYCSSKRTELPGHAQEKISTRATDDPFSPVASAQFQVFDEMFSASSIDKAPFKQWYACSSESSPSSIVGIRGNTEATMDRRHLPFDTPPMTPRSGDSFALKSSDSHFFGPVVSSVGGVGHILPTPPHYCDVTSKTLASAPPSAMPRTEVFENNKAPGIPDNGVRSGRVQETALPTPAHQFDSPTREDSTLDSLRGYKVHDEADKSTPPRTQFPKCACIQGSDGTNDEAPYYTHLGAAESILELRKLFERRTGYAGPNIRIEKVAYTGREGKTSRGCPIAKWIIRRSSEEEKVLIVCRQRPGHRCSTAVVVIIILLWDGVARPLADFAYTNYSDLIPKHGEPTERRCGTNDERTCACQGFDEATCGASFSFGCSWSMYYNGCKYARSNQPNKYKLTGTKDRDAENFIGMLCERLATVMSPLYQMAAPDAFLNQVQYEGEGYECRLGENKTENSRPFSGVTTCLDFCAHAHKDQHNMDNGSTVVVTFTKPELRTIGCKPSDEQLHVLPLYKLDLSDDEANFQTISEKISSGAIEVLHGFRREVRIRKEPKLTKKQKMKARKKSAVDDGFQLSGRRGRPPKRARSFENLLRNDATSPYEEKLGLSPRQWQFQSPTGHLDQTRLRSPSMYADIRAQFVASVLPGTPTRWPYRRQPTIPPAPSIITSPCHMPSPMPKHSVQENGPKSDHLPSIGSFFHENSAAENMPLVDAPHVSGIRPACSLSNTSSEFQKATPLPSIDDVVSHPFHKTFATVKTEPTNVADRQDDCPGMSEHAKIHLKAYAACAHDGRAPTTAPPHRSVINSNSASQYPGLQPSPPQGVFPSRETEFVFSDSEENFMNSNIGGVAVAPGHGSVLIECAKKELHATTPLLHPNRFHPSRISLVFYQHKNLNTRNHGAAEYGAKEEKRQKQREEKKLEEAMRIQEMEKRDIFSAAKSPLPQQLGDARNYSPHPQLIGADISGYHCDAGFVSPPNLKRSLGGLQQHLRPQNGPMSGGTPLQANTAWDTHQDQWPRNNSQTFIQQGFVAGHDPGPRYGSLALPHSCAAVTKPTSRILDLVRSRIGAQTLAYNNPSPVSRFTHGIQVQQWLPTHQPIGYVSHHSIGSSAGLPAPNTSLSEGSRVAWPHANLNLPKSEHVSGNHFPNGAHPVPAVVSSHQHPCVRQPMPPLYRYPSPNVLHMSSPSSCGPSGFTSYSSSTVCSKTTGVVSAGTQRPYVTGDTARPTFAYQGMGLSYPGTWSHGHFTQPVQDRTGQS